MDHEMRFVIDVFIARAPMKLGRAWTNGSELQITGDTVAFYNDSGDLFVALNAASDVVSVFTEAGYVQGWYVNHEFFGDFLQYLG